jgi:IclR family KDG regulon transcriptional repressor
VARSSTQRSKRPKEQLRPADPARAAERQGGGVQSIERAFAILEEVARRRHGIRLAELSKRVGLHNSTTFHLVKTMVSLGYIRQMEDDKSYRIGRPLFALAASALDEIEMISLATPVLEELSRQSGESSHFAVRSGDEVIVIARTTGPGTFQYVDRAGVSRPAHATALGKVLLAALWPDQLECYLERAELQALTPKTIVDVDKLRREVDDVRSRGVAYDDGEFEGELRCVAVPIRDFSGQVIGAIGISGPMWRMTIQLLQSRVQLVQDAAARLSAEFGFGGDESIAAAE